MTVSNNVLLKSFFIPNSSYIHFGIYVTKHTNNIRITWENLVPMQLIRFVLSFSDDKHNLEIFPHRVVEMCWSHHLHKSKLSQSVRWKANIGQHEIQINFHHFILETLFSILSIHSTHTQCTYSVNSMDEATFSPHHLP